ncbi:MAG: hypothetical protein WAV56_02180 [Microgenomates group bacterium]
MSSVFTAAVCSQCGGALNLETLRCEFCSVPHFIDVAKAIPTIASGLTDDQYFSHRDRRADAAILFAIQQTATTHQVRLGLSLSADSSSSTIHVIGYLDDQRPIEIGRIIAYRHGRHYEVDHVAAGRRLVDISWQADLLGGPGARYYHLSVWTGSPILVLGESNLAASEYLSETIGMMVDIVLKRNQRREQARQELLAQQEARPNFFKRLFGEI